MEESVGKEQLTTEERSCADGEREVPEKADGAGSGLRGSSSSGQRRKEERQEERRDGSRVTADLPSEFSFSPKKVGSKMRPRVRKLRPVRRMCCVCVVCSWPSSSHLHRKQLRLDSLVP